MRPAPDYRSRRALLHLSYSSAPFYADGAFVTHDPTRTFGDTLAAPRECPFGFAYTTAFANVANLKKCCIDDLRGVGIHISRTAKARIEGESSAHAEGDTAIRRLLLRKPQRRQTLSRLPARPDRGKAFGRRLKVGAVSIAAVLPTAGAGTSAYLHTIKSARLWS